MAAPSAAILCCLLALLLWVPAGYLIARRLPLERDLRLAAAPVVGWAVQSIVALYVAMAGGFTAMNVLAATALVALAAILTPASVRREPRGPALPLWILAAAAVVATGPAAAILPKVFPAGVALADPLYDHAKVALVDEIVRTGVPPANPFVGSGDGPGGIAYYYYWLFGTAELALLSGTRGWEADIAATWFAAFASLAVMGGLAFRLSGGRAASALFVFAAACGGSLRPVMTALFGQPALDAALEPESGLAGWLFQTTWSPHHVAAAAAVLLSLVLMERLARSASVAAAVVLGLLVAVAFGSSLWVGGITFVLCAGAAGIVLVLSAKPGTRLAFFAALAIAGCLTIVLVLPLLSAQFHAAAERSAGAPVLISAYPVLGPAIPPDVRPWLDIPAYWLILLPIEFPAVWVLGALAVGAAVARRSAFALPAAAIASLCAGALLVSTAGENNDLGWRAVLPGIMILTVFAGAGFAQCLARRRLIATIAGLALLSLALPDGIILLHGNIAGRFSADAALFRDAPALWTAVRRHAAADERIASNPQMMSALGPWPVNLSWALIANRRSCFAGDELALAFSTLTPQARAMAAGLFDRVFAGAGSTADLDALRRDFGCTVVVLTPQDGAWSRDPFATSALFARVEEAEGRWRIYRARDQRATRPPTDG
jgi:hypothetical protein